MEDCNDCSCSNPIEVGAVVSRPELLKSAKMLASATIGWNSIEGAVALYLGINACSVALTGFGLDSVIETASACVIGWRFWSEEAQRNDGQKQERLAAKIVGSLLLCLACYVAVEAILKLAGFEPAAKESIFGIGLTLAALVIMPILAKAKYKSARALNSKAMKAEAFQSLTCAWLAASTLLGLALNLVFHWSWADPVAALLFVPAIVKEGFDALKGDLCADC